jgi:predicted DNA-binding protein (MmcQ/YjbR family)
MNRDELRAYLLAKAVTSEEYPFGPGTAVYKVAGKLFAIVPDDDPLSISLKCDPVLATFLRDTYPAITPGYHLNKRHWNTVLMDGSIPTDELTEMIDHSYDLVVKGLPKRVQQQVRGE